ncbi:hypothetical protein CLOP_g9083 [Closterium sp. NIES-67]|nr:hypothetical protein CLOP_g9083 [Closterium sp. NIES-67]
MLPLTTPHLSILTLERAFCWRDIGPQTCSSSPKQQIPPVLASDVCGAADTALETLPPALQLNEPEQLHISSVVP